MKIYLRIRSIESAYFLMHINAHELTKVVSEKIRLINLELVMVNRIISDGDFW